MKLYLITVIAITKASPEIWNLVSIADSHLEKVKEIYHVKDFVFDSEEETTKKVAIETKE